MAFIFPTHLLSVSEVRGFRTSLDASGAYGWWPQEISSSRKEPKSLPFGKKGFGSPSAQPYLSDIFLLPRRSASTCGPLGLGVEKEGTERATERRSKGFTCELCWLHFCRFLALWLISLWESTSRNSENVSKGGLWHLWGWEAVIKSLGLSKNYCITYKVSFLPSPRGKITQASPPSTLTELHLPNTYADTHNTHSSSFLTHIDAHSPPARSIHL